MNETAETNNTAEEGPAIDRVECPATKDTPVRLYILAVACVAIAIWCVLDMGKSKYDYAAPDKDLNKFLGWLFNHFLPIPLIPLAGLFVVLAVKAGKKVLVADAEGIGYAGKEKITWDSVTGLDAAKLQEKQILYLNCGDGKRLKLDGIKLKNFRDLVAFVEQHAPAGSQQEPAEDQGS